MQKIALQREMASFKLFCAFGVIVVLPLFFLLFKAEFSPALTGKLSQAYLVVTAFGASGMVFWVARHSSSTLKLTWLWLSSGLGIWALGRLVWLITGNDPLLAGEFTLLSFASLTSALCLLMAITCLDVMPVESAARARGLLDGLTIGTVLAFFCWNFVLRYQLENFTGTFLERLGRMIHPVVDIVLISVCLSALLMSKRSKQTSWITTTLLTFGVTLLVLGNLRFSVFENDGLLLAGTPADALWFTGILLMALAAWWPKEILKQRKTSHRRSQFGEFLPSIAAAVILTMLLTLNRDHGLDPMSHWLALCLVVCVLVRQAVSVLEEQRLKHLLEVRVADRTAQLSRREQQFRALVQHSSDVIVIIREDGKFDYVSPSVQHVLGHPAEDIVEGSISDIILPEDRPRVTALLAMANRRVGTTMTAEWRVVRSDNTVRQVEVLVRNLIAEPAVAGIVLNLRDVTERKELEDQLTHQALHDDLTGLANRSLLRVRIEQALAKWLFQNQPFTLLVADLDDFKSINDSLGHVVGDEVLKTVSDQIAYCTRSGDTIVRLAGDEFAVLLEGVAAADEEASNIAANIIRRVQEPMRVEGRNIAMRVSLGLACVTEQVSQADDIMRNADLALHAAKLTKRGSFVQFEAAMHDTAMRRVELEADLRRALENDELHLYYQPTVNLQTGIIDGVEALLRWTHPEKGFISPADFIPLAEESGLIVPIGTWVLEKACEDITDWRHRYARGFPLTLNVNLSARQLDQPDIVETVARVLESTGMAPGDLVLEMTESVLMENKPTTLAKMQGLVDLGVELAIDDFGTGYSSLSYLRQFPMSILKVDRSFVNCLGAEGSDEDTALVQAIVDLASTLRMRTVAEGIETPEQLAILRSMGCDIGQGFLLARPAPADEICRLIEETFAVGLPLPTVNS